MGILAIIVVIVAAIVLTVTRDSTPRSQQGSSTVNITDYIDKPSTVEYTIEGDLNAEEDHRAIRISINRNMRTVEVLSGYNKTVIKTQSYPNTQAAYDEFMYGLKNAGFTRQQEAEFSNDNGVCPLGTRYIYKLRDDNGEVLRLWSTSCRRKDGSMGGNTDLIRRLFQKQIPNYGEVIKGVKI